VDAFALADQVLAVLTPDTFAHLPTVLLIPHCLICGKALRDPASMARGIGPECFGSSTLNVPGLYQLSATVNDPVDIGKE